MKKLFAAFITVLYLGLSSGFAVNVHYCMGKIVSQKLNPEKTGKCGKCGMTNKGGCCEDELTLLKINDSHQANYSSYTFQQSFQLIPQDYTHFQAVPLYISPITSVQYSLPPEATYPSLYLLYKVFRI